MSIGFAVVRGRPRGHGTACHGVGEDLPRPFRSGGGDIRLIAFITEPAETAGRSRLTASRRFASGRRPGWLRPRIAAPPPILPARGPPAAWGGRPGNRFLGRGRPGRREHTAHEPVISSVIVAELPLAGRSFGRGVEKRPHLFGVQFQGRPARYRSKSRSYTVRFIWSRRDRRRTAPARSGQAPTAGPVRSRNERTPGPMAP